MVMGLQPIILSNNSWTNQQPCQLSWQLCPSARCRSTSLHTHARPHTPACTHARTHAAAHLSARPRWGPENVARLSHLNPARMKPDRRSVFNPVEISDTSGPHQVEGNLLGCSVRSSSMHPGGLCLPVSRSASSDGQSHAADDPAGQSVTQRPTRPDLMSCVRPW